MASYPGLGGISAYGYDQNGQASLGPYSFLPWAGGNAPTMINGSPSLNDLTFGGRPTNNPTGSVASTSGTAGMVGSGGAGDGFLSSVAGGTKLPYGEDWQSAQMGEASDMSSAAEGARNGQATANAVAGGASATDPSLQGQRLASMGQRQAQNQSAKRDISGKASAGNFDAQMRAAEDLNRNQMQREQFQQQQQLAQQGYGHQAMQQAMSYMPWGSSGGSRGGNRGNSGSGNFIGMNNGLGATRFGVQSGYGFQSPWDDRDQPNYGQDNGE